MALKDGTTFHSDMVGSSREAEIAPHASIPFPLPDIGDVLDDQTIRGKDPRTEGSETTQSSFATTCRSASAADPLHLIFSWPASFAK